MACSGVSWMDQMSILSAWLYCSIIIQLWTGAYSDCFTLYSSYNRYGSTEQWCDDVTQFGSLDNKVKSIRITGTKWLAIFLEPDYQGYCKVLPPRSFNLVSNDVNSASSAHFVSASSHLAKCGPQPSMSNSESHKQGVGCGDAIYICNTGYNFKDNSNTMIIKCQTSGNWQSFPDTCQRKCGTIPNVPRSTSVIAGYSPGSTVTYTCDKGYVFNGNTATDTVTCKSGSWTQPPNGCNKIRCGNSKPTVSNAASSGSDRYYGDLWTYTCSTGYVYPDGSKTQTIVCGADGSWGTPAYSACQMIRCDSSPPNITNTTHLIKSSSYNGVTSYTCVKGHEFPDKSQTKNIKCTAQGSWESAPPPCQLKRCKTDKVIENTTYKNNGDVYGSTRIYVCDVGHEFTENVTSVTITCQSDGTWSASPSACPVKLCPTPPSIPYREVTAEGTHYTARAKYRCISGHVTQNASPLEEVIWCNDDKSWNATPSACTRHEYYIGCVALSSLSGQDLQKQSLNALTGDPINVCRQHCAGLQTFQLAGLTKGAECRCYAGPAPSSVDADQTCSANCKTLPTVKCGSSTHTTLFYAGQNCSSPPNVHQSSSDISLSSSSYFYNTAVNFTCTDGRQFSDGNSSKIIRCGATGQWIPVIGSCRTKGKYIDIVRKRDGP